MVMKAFNLTEADWDALGDEPEQDKDNTSPPFESFKVSEEGLKNLHILPDLIILKRLIKM